MDHWIKTCLEQFGALGVGVVMLVENIFPPIPSEEVVPWAGYSDGVVGPDLTPLGGRRSINAAVLENTPAKLRRWIGSTHEAKPGVEMVESGVEMPESLALPEDEMDVSDEYLGGLQ